MGSYHTDFYGQVTQSAVVADPSAEGWRLTVTDGTDTVVMRLGELALVQLGEQLVELFPRRQQTFPLDAGEFCRVYAEELRAGDRLEDGRVVRRVTAIGNEITVEWDDSDGHTYYGSTELVMVLRDVCDGGAMPDARDLHPARGDAA